jgi:hypothetical protein
MEDRPKAGDVGRVSGVSGFAISISETPVLYPSHTIHEKARASERNRDRKPLTSLTPLTRRRGRLEQVMLKEGIFQCLRSNALTFARFRQTPRSFVALALTDPHSAISSASRRSRPTRGRGAGGPHRRRADVGGLGRSASRFHLV